MATSKNTHASTVSNRAKIIDDDITDDDDQHGLIILGNSGVGKSFLANVLLGREAFVHEFSSSSVTHITEFREMDLGYDTFAVFNIPGLIEAEQERIDLNKIEIDKAFAQRPDSIIMFVFGQQGGRIREEDIVAFNAINAAYPFRPESLILVVNGLPKARPPKYEGTTLVLLQRLLKDVSVNNRNLCFLDEINANDSKEKQRLKEKLLQVIVEFQPSIHKKKQEIVTLIDQLKEGKKMINEQRKQFEADREKYMKQIEDSQRMLNETVANHHSETESLQRAMQRQEELYAEQQRRFEEENRKYQTQLQDLRGQAEQAQRNYEALRHNHEATQQEVRASQEAHQQLQNAYQALVNQPAPVPPKKKKKKWYEPILEIIPVVKTIHDIFSKDK